jgi:hypothetical protein
LPPHPGTLKLSIVFFNSFTNKHSFFVPHPTADHLTDLLSDLSTHSAPNSLAKYHPKLHANRISHPSSVHPSAYSHSFLSSNSFPHSPTLFLPDRHSNPVIILSPDPATILSPDPATILVTDPATILVTDPATILVTDPVTILVTDPVIILSPDPATILVTDPVTILVIDPVTILVTDPVTILVTDSPTDCIPNSSSNTSANPSLLDGHCGANIVPPSHPYPPS